MVTSSFVNRAIHPDDLPKLDPAAFVPVSDRHRTLLFIGRAFSALVAVIFAIAVPLVFGLDRRLIVGLVALCMTITVPALVSVPIVHRYLGWQVRDHDISTRRGVFTRSVATLPFSRVQNVALRQTFLDRMFSLGRLDVFSAGVGGDLFIVGLEADTAERLRLLVLERAGVDHTDSNEPVTQR